jgi:hypothetical protein
MEDARKIDEQIMDHVMAFSSVDPTIHFPEIITQWKVYKIMQNQEGPVCYCLSNEDGWMY